MEAGLGQAQCLSRVAMLEQEPDYQVNAALIRRLYALFEGDAARGVTRARADQLRIELGLQSYINKLSVFRVKFKGSCRRRGLHERPYGYFSQLQLRSRHPGSLRMHAYGPRARVRFT